MPKEAFALEKSYRPVTKCCNGCVYGFAGLSMIFGRKTVRSARLLCHLVFHLERDGRVST